MGVVTQAEISQPYFWRGQSGLGVRSGADARAAVGHGELDRFPSALTVVSCKMKELSCIFFFLVSSRLPRVDTWRHMEENVLQGSHTDFRKHWEFRGST